MFSVLSARVHEGYEAPSLKRNAEGAFLVRFTTHNLSDHVAFIHDQPLSLAVPPTVFGRELYRLRVLSRWPSQALPMLARSRYFSRSESLSRWKHPLKPPTDERYHELVQAANRFLGLAEEE